MNSHTAPRIEILESRVAPAVFFVNGTNLSITDSTGANATDSVDELAAAVATGATKAILLNAGDSVVYDLDGDRKVDAGTDVTFVKITAGKAMAFFTDRNTDAGIGQTGQFDVSEFTGLAVGDGVKATIGADLFGSIDTLLTGAGAFTTVRQPSSIAELKITGSVYANIQAGGNISNVTFTTPKGTLKTYDVGGGILTGSAADNGQSFDGEMTTTLTTFTQAPGTDAGDITNIKLGRYVESIVAGNGGDQTTGTGGAGGSVSNVTSTGFLGSEIRGGDGGAVSVSGAGGAGGAVSKITLNLAGDAGGDVLVRSGRGGLSANGAGGAGGEATNVTIKSSAILDGEVGITGGAGGAGGGTGGGGMGGGVSNSTITILGWVNDSIYMVAGAGGNGSGNGGAGGAVTKTTITSAGHSGGVWAEGGEGGAAGGSDNTGGAGGAVSFVTLKASGYTAGLTLEGGRGGSGGGATGTGGVGGSVSKSSMSGAISSDDFIINGGVGGYGGNTGGNGGKGGDITDTTVTATGNAADDIRIVGGRGGNVSGGDGFTGGTGGAVSGVTVKALGGIASELGIYGGGGGQGGTGTDDGGAGGNVSKITVSTLFVGDAFRINGGVGGSSGVVGGTGGRGGDLLTISTTNLGYVDTTIEIQGGLGGDGLGIGNGGAGGNATGITVTNKGGMASLAILGGEGSDSGAGGGNGGNSGDLANVTVNSFADIAEKILIGSEGGASCQGSAGNGGDGGDATNIKVTDKFGTRGTWFISAGPGGDGLGSAALGGDGGDLLTVTFTGAKSHVLFGDIGSGAGGDGPLSMGGDGGIISGIKGTAATLRIVAHRGGDADGIGGAGGSVEDVTFNVTQFARIIAAGDGGWVDAGGTAGNGGSITNVKITGTGVIGDFSEHFLVMADADAGMGGLVVGQGGAVNGSFNVIRNGTIDGVTATRIAAVIAGAQAGLNVSNFNAVQSITGLKAALIGADYDGDRQFDWVEGTATQAGFQLSGAPGTTDIDDVPGDGIVIVKTGGYTPDAKTTLFTPVIFV